jgi:hypothetical protein
MDEWSTTLLYRSSSAFPPLGGFRGFLRPYTPSDMEMPEMVRVIRHLQIEQYRLSRFNIPSFLRSLILI